MGQDTQIDNEDERPKWLLELENRKRKPRLAHEVGAGAPCIKCNSSCPGLDLHFWRKICKNCKCGRDDHDVPDDEFPQFDLLFGNSVKPKRRAIVLKINKQQTDNEETFDWAPPDTTKELAADYMKALPQDKLPIKGSVGAALRKQQLQKQLPLHDIDHKMCDELSESERKQFEQYLENIKNYVGQGKVSKIITAKPFEKSSLITPINASESLTPKHKAHAINSQPVNLRTPSSFVPVSMKSSLVSSITTQENSTNILQNDPSQLLGPKINNQLINDPLATQSRLETVRSPILGKAMRESPKSGPGCYHALHDPVKTNERMAEVQVVPGNTPLNCANMNKISHEKYCVGQFSNENLPEAAANIPAHPSFKGPLNQAYKASVQSAVVGNITTLPKVPEYSINSQPLNKHHPALNFAASNLHANTNKAVNECGSLPYQKVEAVRSEQAKSDSSPLKSHPWAKKWNKVDDGDQNDDLADKMMYDALMPPSSINSSDIIGSTLDQKGLSYIREKLSNKYNAKEEPVNIGEALKYRELRNESCADDKNVKNNSDFKRPHNQSTNNNGFKGVQAHFSSYRTPENSIISSESLNNPAFPEEAVGTSRIMEDPNVDRLRSGLHNLLIGQTNVKSRAVQKCHECAQGIFVGDVVVTAEKATDAAWHPGCFVCSACNELLVDLVYFYYKGKLYCARDLANLLGIPRCFACDELIFVGEYTVAEGHNYHVKHFCCWDCDVPLAGQQYISENDRPLCLRCFQTTYAKTCSACKQLIAADQQGVAVKTLNFHASDKCFCCASCKKSLLNGRMAIKDNKPFCSKECISMYLNHNR